MTSYLNRCILTSWFNLNDNSNELNWTLEGICLYDCRF